MSSTVRARTFECLPWENFGRWVYCICVVTFDLELGQSIEVVYPGDAQLTVDEKISICYLAFPDSNSGFAQDTNFYFRVRRSSVDVHIPLDSYSVNVPSALDIDAAHFYGFVHYRQKKDPSLPRGYFQKSLVLLTLLPLFDLFSIVVGSVAYGFFESGEPAIEAACHHIDQWPTPAVGVSLRLPLMGSVIHCRIPCQIDMYTSQRQQFLDVKLVSSGRDIELVSILDKFSLLGSMYFVINYAQLLWELVLTGEPIIVLAHNPSQCSSFVHSLTRMIFPLKYSNDFRPYFTIHDADFRDYSASNRLTSHAIIGVTNPYFAKVFRHWPHILRMYEPDTRQNAVAGKRMKTWDERMLEMKYGLFSQYKMFLHKDKSLYKDLLKLNSHMQMQVLERRMAELTQGFMMPLENYVSSLLPLKKHLSPFKNVPKIYPFRDEDFYTSLDESRLSQICGYKGDWKGLYRKFMASSNFEEWLRRKTAELDKQLRYLHLEMLCNADLNKETLKDRTQVEIVDLVLKITDRLKDLDDSLVSARTLLQSQISEIMASVDDDLKSILLSNGALRECI